MININFIRENKEKVKKGIEAKGYDSQQVDDTLKLYDKWTEKLQIWEKLRQERKKIAHDSKGFSAIGKGIKEKVVKAEIELQEAWKNFDDSAKEIPNLPADDVKDKKEILDEWGKIPKFNFKPKDHLEIGETLDIIDVERAAKVSGTRFGYLKGDAVLLEFALVNFAMEKLIKEGFTPILPPMLIKKEITRGLGYWCGSGNENYYYVLDFEEGAGGKELQNPLYLIGTGEHAVVPLHKDEILDQKSLPKKYIAFSSCFRREAGTYGQDTRGILRVHQFDKVEMVVFSTQEESERILKQMVKISQNLMQELGLPHRVVKLANWDISFPSAKTIDIETWLPGQGNYRETHSISTTTDYQSERLNIKYKTPEGNKFVHILNGTSLAIGRTIIAILENYQNKDGSVTIPEVLRKWMGKDKITS